MTSNRLILCPHECHPREGRHHRCECVRGTWQTECGHSFRSTALRLFHVLLLCCHVGVLNRCCTQYGYFSSVTWIHSICLKCLFHKLSCLSHYYFISDSTNWEQRKEISLCTLGLILAYFITLVVGFSGQNFRVRGTTNSLINCQFDP
jgi:hypothetical protein